MNYYAQGGQAQGLKALAQELPKYGRYGDDVVAHISSDEARMLQSMGGSGTINPQTGLPEFFLKKIARPFVQGIKAIQNIPGIKQVSDVATQAVKPIDQAFVGLDKTVGKTIPGGWGTLGMVAASMIPGAQFAALGLGKTAAMTGLGALTGSGVLRPEGKFNLQGAVMGGALAYGAANLAAGLEGAAEGATKTGAAAVEEAAKAGTQSALTGTGAGYVPSDFLSGTSIGAGATNAASGAGSAFTPTANALAGVGDFVAPAVTSGGASSGIGALSTAAQPASFGLNAAVPQAGTSALGIGNVAVQPGFLESAGNYISNLPANIAGKATSAYDALTTPSNYADFASDYGANVSKIGSGIKNLVTGAPGASAGFSSAGASLTNTALPIAMGAQGLMALEEQRNYLQDQLNTGAISNAEYQSQLAEINRQAGIASQAVSQSPFNANPSFSVERQPALYDTSGDTLYAGNPAASSATLYAMGGSVDDEFGMDEARGMMQGNLQKGLFGQGYAAGGMASGRFLSGGGDGMSDNIPASIEGKQEARLADGEFVVPADVVSHLGNGSSKAGAKRLYSMMDKVRHARTGNKKQGKQINPDAFLAA
jgi:hypothetical protein